jgi:ABC-type uncharacterized transport system substrate-binding protein
MRPIRPILLSAAMLAVSTVPATVHPHVFAEAKLDVALTPDKQAIQSLKHHWLFDDVFSSTVIVEFDKNGDNKLDAEELKEVSKTVFESIGEYAYFQIVTQDAKDVAMRPPADLAASFQGNQLIIQFHSEPAQPFKLAGKIDIGIYDPTFYTAIEYLDDKDLVVGALPPGCASKVVRPDPDEVIAQNQKAMDEAFMSDPSNVNAGMGKLFATRLELTCQASG